MPVVLPLRRTAVFALLALVMLPLAACSSAEDRARSHYQRGTELVAQGDPVKAILEFRNAIKLQGNNVDALFALGKAQEQQGSYADAARNYLTVVELAPGHVEARVRLSYILVAGGQLDEAQTYVDQAVGIAKDDPSVLLAQAALAVRRGDHAKGVEFAQAALAADPESVDAMMLLASERMTEGDPAGALAYLEKAPAGSESSLGLQVLKLSVLDAMDDQPAVEGLFVKLIDLFPDNAAFRDAFMRWYLEKDRDEDAERILRDAAAKAPLDDQARLTLVAFLASYRGNDLAYSELESAIAERKAAKGDTYALRVAYAQLAAQEGRTAVAVETMQSVVAETGDVQKRNSARIQLARMLVAEKNEQGAEDIVEAVLAEDSRNVDALSVRASLRLMRGAHAEAIEDMLAAINEAPDDANLHGLLGEAYERDGNTVLAEQQYAKALDLNQYTSRLGVPFAQFFLRHGKPDQAVRVLELVRKREPQNRQVLELLGQLKITARDWLGAQQIADTLRQLGAAGENDLAADRLSAAVLFGLNRHDESIELLQRAITDGDSRQTVLPDLIAAYLQANKVEAAREYLLETTAEDPEDTEAQILLGSVFAREGRADLAEQALRKAADIKPGLDGDLALAQYYVSVARADDAEAVVQAGLKEEPTNKVLRMLLAAIYEQQQRFDDAIAVHEALYAEDPTAIAGANDLASLISERRSDPASLERAFQIAQRLRGSDVPQYLDTLGWIYYLRGDYAEALPLLRSAADKLADVPLIHYHLGMTYAALQQNDLARASLQRALETALPLGGADVERVKAALAKLTNETTAASAQKS